MGDVVIGDCGGEMSLAGATSPEKANPRRAGALRVLSILTSDCPCPPNVSIDASIEILEGLVLERAEVADAQQLLVLAPLLLAHTALAGDQPPEVGVGDRHLEAHVAGVEADRALRRGLRRGPVASAGTFRDRTFQILED